MVDLALEELQIRILGPLEVWWNGAQADIGRPSQRAVLGRLALTPDTWISRDDIIADLWGNSAPEGAAAILKSHISRLRTVLEPKAAPRIRAREGIITASGRNYRLRVNRELDVIACQELHQEARQAASDGDAQRACALFDRALSLWRGEPLTDIDVLRRHWATARLSHNRTVLLTEFAEVAFPLGWHDQVLPHAQSAAATGALDERIHALLMLALAGSGQQSTALRVFEGIKKRLADDLGIAPSPALAEAHLRVLRQEVSSW